MMTNWDVKHISNGPCILEPNCETSKCCISRPYNGAPKELSCPWNRSSSSSWNNGDYKPTGITVALMYYAQPSNLLQQLKNFASYPKQLRQCLTLLIVDDGSPPGLRAQDVVSYEYKQSYQIRIASILEDYPWNTPQARNLAFCNTVTLRVLMIDLDLLVPIETFASLLKVGTKRRGMLYFWNKFSVAHRLNRQFDRGETKFHPSAAFLDVHGWWQAGGADEDFSGNYGCEDHAFWYNFDRSNGRQIRHRRIFLEQTRGRSDSESPLLTNHSQHACREHKKKHIEKNATQNSILLQHKVETSCWSNSYLRVPWKLLE